MKKAVLAKLRKVAAPSKKPEPVGFNVQERPMKKSMLFSTALEDQSDNLTLLGRIVMREATDVLPPDADQHLRRAATAKLKQFGLKLTFVGPPKMGTRWWHAALSPAGGPLPKGRYSFSVSKSGPSDPWVAEVTFRTSDTSDTRHSLAYGKAHGSVSAALKAMKKTKTDLSKTRMVPDVRVGTKVRGEYYGAKFTGTIDRGVGRGLSVKLSEPLTVMGSTRDGLYIEPRAGIFPDNTWFELAEDLERTPLQVDE